MLYSSLQKRLLTASWLIPLVIGSIVFLDLKAFAIMSALIFLGGVWEWSRLAGFESTLGRLFCVASLLLLDFCSLIALQALETFGPDHKIFAIICLVFLFWMIALMGIIIYPRAHYLFSSKGVGILIGAALLGPFWGSLIILKALDPQWILYVLALVWSCDTGAYFIGKGYGKKKLAPVLSPGKTWEGVLGGISCGFIVIGLGALYLEPRMPLLHWMILGFMTLVFSIVGDLFESLFKRLRGLKDSGSLLPGHGGILDRIDSLTAALPIFCVGMLFFG